MTLPKLLIWTLVLFALAQTLFYLPQLPDIMATHFDGAGRPNGWASKTAFFALYLAFVAMLLLIFLGGGRLFMLRRDMRIPNREYWLAPERKEETIAFFRRRMLWMGVASIALAVIVTQLVIEANFLDPPRMSANIYWVLLGYFLYVALWLASLFLRFRRRGELR